MRFALLGADSESLALAAAAVAAGHELVWQGDLSQGDPATLSSPEANDCGDDWEDLLVEETADAILIGRGAAAEDLRLRQLQELTRLGRPVLTTFPLFASVLSYFEVDMSRTEGGALLQHYNPLRESPLGAESTVWLEEGHPSFGRLEQIVATRIMANRSREQVLQTFARDVDLLACVAGKLNRIGAHASSGKEADYSALSIQLLGPVEIPIRWNVEPPQDEEGLQLQFIFERGRETFWFDSTGQGKPQSIDPAAAAIEHFAADVTAHDAAQSTWPQALRAMELTDSIEISLRRGRIVDVHDQQLTEQLAFRGAMSAFGCGILLLIVPALLIVGWIAGLLGIPIAAYWPHALLAILALFLAVQLLPKLFGKPPIDDGESS